MIIFEVIYVTQYIDLHLNNSINFRKFSFLIILVISNFSKILSKILFTHTNTIFSN